MTGTILIIAPIIIAIGFYVAHAVYGDYYNDGFMWLGGIFAGIALIVVLLAVGTYVNTSTYPSERESLQSTLDNARESATQYEMATITRDVMDFNRKLEVDQNFFHKHFSLWINDDILELEPIR